MSQLHRADAFAILPTIADNSVSMVLTDIPYGLQADLGCLEENVGLGHPDMSRADGVDFSFVEMVKQLARVCSGTIYIFCGSSQASELMLLFSQADLWPRLCAWEKINPAPFNGSHFWLSSIEYCVVARKRGGGVAFNKQEHFKSAVWRDFKVPGALHPTQKPVSLFVRLIRASSNEGDTVLDPFMGSGTTGVACHDTGRQFIGIERDPEYFGAAERRLRLEEQQLRLISMEWAAKVAVAPRRVESQPLLCASEDENDPII